MNKKYVSLLAVAGILASFALVSPAFAQTTSTQPPQNHGAGRFGGMMKNGGGRGVFGTVASINGTTLTVTSKIMQRPGSTSTTTPTATTYTVDASSATVTKNNAASLVSAIAVGDTISVQGTITGTNIVAKTIRDGVPQKPVQTAPVITGNGQPIVAGKVTAVSGNTITITNSSNVTYTVDATNATIAIKNVKSTISGVSVGDSVVVQGTVNGNSVAASSVNDSGVAKVAVSGSSTITPSTGFMGGMMQGIKNFFKMFGF